MEQEHVFVASLPVMQAVGAYLSDHAEAMKVESTWVWHAVCISRYVCYPSRWDTLHKGDWG